MSSSKLLPLAACVTAALLLASCSSNRAPQSTVTPGQSAGISGPDDFNRPHRDGAPWWDVDVSKIQDAIPMPHYGPVKASPYVVFGKQYYPIQDARRYQATGPASWYGTKFHGQATANGETYDLYGMTAAHKTLPLPSLRTGDQSGERQDGDSACQRPWAVSIPIASSTCLSRRRRSSAMPRRARRRSRSRVSTRMSGGRSRGVRCHWCWPTISLPRQPLPSPSRSRCRKWSSSIRHHRRSTPRPSCRCRSTQKKNDSLAASGLYLQVGAFANPDAAELLKSKLSQTTSVPVFISSVVRDQQILHRVRLGPISNQGEAEQLQSSVRLANLGQPTLVRAD